MKDGFFHVVSTARFAELLMAFPPLPRETAPLAEAAGRVLAEDAVADQDLPLTPRSSMDGFAVRARDVFGAGESNPAYLEKTADIAIDRPPDFALEPGACAGIVTGGVLPDGADAVVMVEHTGQLGAGTIEIRKSVAPGDNVMLRGEDALAGHAALAAGTVLRPQEVGLLAALGIAEPTVRARPRCAIVSTGDELVPIGQVPQPGQVRDVNSYTLAALAAQAGGAPRLYGLAPDDEAALTDAVARAVAENDVIFLSGGSSVGLRDLTQAAVTAQPDSEILAHGVALAPGKPTILARVGTKAVWGLPGQVTSAQIVMLVFGRPFLRHLQGDPAAFDASRRRTLRVRLARNVASRPGREDYVRVRLDQDGAHPVLGRSGLLKTMIQAHGLVCVPADSEGLEAGTNVDVWMLD